LILDSKSPRRRFRAGATAVLAVLALAFAPRSGAAAPPGFAFLEIPAGARASAMGGAYASIAQGVEAAFWNPAGLGALKGIQFTASHAELDQQLHYDAVALGGRVWGGGYGLSLRALYSEAIDSRDDLGNLIGTFGSHDLEFAFSYGRALGSGLSLGGSAQLVRERLADVAAMTQAYGFGATWQPPPLDWLRASLGVQNLGPAARYTFDGIPGQDIPLPTAIHAGVSTTALAGRGLTVRGAFEGRFTEGRSGLGSIGGELVSQSGASLRAGWRINDASSDFTLGAGFEGKTLGFDYAYIPLSLDLGESHRFSIRAQF
jgi:hypothetical protein